MKMKAEELEGAALDWAVAKCENNEITFDAQGSESGAWEMYSTNWEKGGPLIEREKIATDPDADDGMWAASIKEAPCYWVGPTALVAAMRCLVATKLGPEVEIPDELALQQPAKRPAP